ncbi:MAG TPA: hypothetical protein VFE06_06210 [Acidobacteriaceae bacterium]|jgi:uncharacterized membrane protein|nr:hypothetical protein [Acidobacteriaceae bacterium]
MTLEVGGMIAAGVAALVAGLILARPRFRTAGGAGKLITLGPAFEASALAAFSAEHFTAARDLAPIVPHWLPAPLFWTYFFGTCLLAAALSFIVWRCVRSAAALLALFFLLVVVTIDLPSLPRHLHDHIFWTLTVRETAFASGALVLSGSLWPRGHAAGQALVRIFRTLLAAILVFYAIEHFLFPHFVIGVPLEKPTPAWIPAPTLWACLVGIALLLGAIGLLFRPTIRIASAGLGLVLLLVIVLFYVPILVHDSHSPGLAVEGLNYVFDTLLFASTVLLAGFGAEPTPA